MNFLISVIDSQTGNASGDEMAAITAFNDGLRAAGHWVFACGLEAPTRSAVIDGRGASADIAHRPLIESTDYISGFWIITAPDRDVATALATEASRCCSRRVELRQMLGD